MDFDVVDDDDVDVANDRQNSFLAEVYLVGGLFMGVYIYAPLLEKQPGFNHTGAVSLGVTLGLVGPIVAVGALIGCAMALRSGYERFNMFYQSAQNHAHLAPHNETDQDLRTVGITVV